MIEKIQALFYNKKMTKVIYAPLRYKMPVFALVFIVSGVFFYGFFVNPVLNKNAAVASRIKSMKQQIPKLIKKQKDIVAIKQQIKELEEHNAEERFSIPKKQPVPLFLSTLNDAIRKTNLKIIDLSPSGVQKNKYLDLYAINFKAKLSGDFSQLIKLFVILIDMKDIAVITRISIKKESKSKLIITLNLETYSRQGVGV